MTEFDCPEATLCSWQDVKILLLTNQLQSHFIWSHIRRMYVCLPVSYHLHFGQNDWDLLCATAVRQGWNGYQISQHRKLTLENKIILPGIKPLTFWSWALCSTPEPSLTQPSWWLDFNILSCTGPTEDDQTPLQVDAHFKIHLICINSLKSVHKTNLHTNTEQNHTHFRRVSPFNIPCYKTT